MSLRRLLAGLSVAALASGSWLLSPVASADPGFVPGAADLVGVGSDTTEISMNEVAVGYNATAPAAKLASFDATGPGGAVHDTITVRAGVTIQRPNGSTEGKNVLYGAGNNANISFARSSSALSSAEVSAGLYAFPFAKDTLVMAVRAAGSNAPANLTGAQILGIYKGEITNWSQVGGTAGTIVPLIPQAGSGTRSFFLGQLKALNGGVDVTVSTAWKTTQEHADTDLKDNVNAVGPMSQGRGELLGTLRYPTGWSAARAVYNVVRSADVASPAFTAVFGSTGYLCSPAAKLLIEKGGLSQLAGPGAGGACGVATQTATNNLVTGQVDSTATLAGTSPAGGEAKLTATVASSTPNPQGTVTFFLDGAKVGTAAVAQGTASFTAKGLTPGAHKAIAAFKPGSGTAWNASQSAETTVTVKSGSVTTLAIEPASSTYGQTRSVVATVMAGTAPATGTVTFDLGGTKSTATLAAGKASVSLPATTPASTIKVTATYDGNDTVAPSSASGNVVIAKAKAKVVAKKFTPGVKSAKGVILVKVKGAQASGSVKVKLGKKVVGKAKVKKGKATVALKGLKSGKNKVVVTYSGNANIGKAKLKFTVSAK